jgi:hypothetical protein
MKYELKKKTNHNLATFDELNYGDIFIAKAVTTRYGDEGIDFLAIKMQNENVEDCIVDLDNNMIYTDIEFYDVIEKIDGKFVEDNEEAYGE